MFVLYVLFCETFLFTFQLKIYLTHVSFVPRLVNKGETETANSIVLIVSSAKIRIKEERRANIDKPRTKSKGKKSKYRKTDKESRQQVV